MAEAAGALDKSGKTIQAMFAGVAPRYDLLNRVLSVRLDGLWRRAVARAVGAAPGQEVLDLCCGTGDQAVAIARRGARVVAADFCLPMLALAQGKLAAGPRAQPVGRPRIATADALSLPFGSERFDGVTVSFGLRNVADLDASLREILRVLKPGGRLVVLECGVPRSALVRGPYMFYFTRILPRIGALLSPRGSAYVYLPNSVLAFPLREAFTGRLRGAGFAEAEWRDLTAGTVCLYVGKKGL